MGNGYDGMSCICRQILICGRCKSHLFHNVDKVLTSQTYNGNLRSVSTKCEFPYDALWRYLTDLALGMICGHSVLMGVLVA